jgi:hypothetical protein
MYRRASRLVTTIVKTDVYVQYSEEVAKEQKEKREPERVEGIIMREEIMGGPIHLTYTSSKPFAHTKKQTKNAFRNHIGH